jgi:hypothetical protein
MQGNKYIRDFLKLRCAGDVLNAVGELRNGEAEISVAMSTINHIKEIKDLKEYILIEICDKNRYPITSIISAHLLPIKYNFVSGGKLSNNIDCVKKLHTTESPLVLVKSYNKVIVIINIEDNTLGNKVFNLFRKNKNLEGHLIRI